MFEEKYLKPDIALVQVCPPDDKGYCSLGTSVDCVRSALSHAKYIVGKFSKFFKFILLQNYLFINFFLFLFFFWGGMSLFIALVNKHMPRTFGDASIHVSHLDFAVEHHTPLPVHPVKPPSKEEQQIGKYIAENLVENGATMQMGIGSIPDAVLSLLDNHKNLGIHSEMFSDGVVDLVNKGCITNNCKPMHKGRIVGSFCIGSEKLYDFMHDNPFIGELISY